MEIRNVRIESFFKGGFENKKLDSIQHIKTLPFLSVVQAVEGSYDIVLGAGEGRNTGASGFFIAPSYTRQTIVHHTDPSTGRMTCRWIFVKALINDLYDIDTLYELPVIVPDAFRPPLHDVFDRLFSSPDRFCEYACCHEILSLLVRMSEEKKTAEGPYVRDALTYIRTHYREKIAVEDLAAAVNTAPSHFFSVFRKAMGVSPIRYLNTYRLSLAVDWLVNSSLAIHEIAALTGIGDPVYFSRLFRRAYQMSPGAYRELYQKNGAHRDLLP